MTFSSGFGQHSELPKEVFKSKFKQTVKFDSAAWVSTNELFEKFDAHYEFEPIKSNYFFAIVSHDLLSMYKTNCSKDQCTTSRFRSLDKLSDSAIFQMSAIPIPLQKSLMGTTEFQLPDKSTYLAHDGSNYFFQAFDDNGYRHFWTDFPNKDQNNILLFHLYIFDELSKRTIKRINKGR